MMADITEPLLTEKVLMVFSDVPGVVVANLVRRVCDWSSAVAGPNLDRVSAFRLAPIVAAGAPVTAKLLGASTRPATAYVRVPFGDEPIRVPDAPLPDDAVCACVVDSRAFLKDEELAADPKSVRQLGLTLRNHALSKDEFARHWREVHAPLALGAGPLYFAYTQNVVLGDDVPWDGIGETAYPSIEAAHEHHRRNQQERPNVLRDTQYLLRGGERYWATAP